MPPHDRKGPLTWEHMTWEPHWGIGPQTYALRACHDALLPGSGRHRRCSWGCNCWRLLVVHGPSGAPRGHDLATCAIRVFAASSAAV
jgi:hypothetical protein